MNYNNEWNELNYKRFYRHKDQYNQKISIMDYVGAENTVYNDDITDGLKEDIRTHLKSFTLEERHKVNFIIQQGLESDPVIINDDWIFAILHKIAEEVDDLTHKQITFETGNWNINKVYNKWLTKNNISEQINVVGAFELIRIYSPKLWDYHNKDGVLVDLDYRTDFTPKIKPYVYTALNRAPHRHRMELFLKLKEFGILGKGMVSFNEVSTDALSRELTQEEINMLPITLDVDLEKSSPFEHIYGETMPQAFSYMEQKEYDTVPNEFLNFFENSYFSVVTETKIGIPSTDDIYCDENNCDGVVWPSEGKFKCIRCETQKQMPEWTEIYDEKFITEKTWRNLLNGHPMVWIGTRHTAKMLQHLGFKTFNSLWDESYDEVRNPLDRFYMATNIINELCQKTDEEWLELQEKALPILKHNQNKMLELEDILRITKEDTLHGEIKWKMS